jgi:hypothetical protein
VVWPVLVIKGGADTVGWPATISVIETGVEKVDSGVSVTVLVIVGCVLWDVPRVPGLTGVVVTWVKGVVVIGDSLVGAQDTWLGRPCQEDGSVPWDLDMWE